METDLSVQFNSINLMILGNFLNKKNSYTTYQIDSQHRLIRGIRDPNSSSSLGDLLEARRCQENNKL